MVEQIDITINGGDVDKIKPESNYKAFAVARGMEIGGLSCFIRDFDFTQTKDDVA